ncbi:hypothetical protein AB0J52_29465 [Spirillospora sp. NPDC049652]
MDLDRLASALASLASVPVSEVAVHDEDSLERNWDALVGCEYGSTLGDVDWRLEIYVVTSSETRQPSRRELAAGLAEQLGTVVLYDAGLVRPSAYLLVTPDGRQARARVREEDGADDDAQPRLVIDAVEMAVPSLPHVPVALIPEVIPEYRMSTPVRDGLQSRLATLRVPAEAEEALSRAGNLLGAWESTAVRMASGWPPDGWYPLEYYRQALECRDELAAGVERLPAAAAERFADAVNQIDNAFRSATGEDGTSAAALFGIGEAELAGRSWWWRRLPDPRPWPDTP